MIVSWCFGCVMFRMGENCVAKCWYSGSNLIVHSIKYFLHMFLCEEGCIWSILGMGPGFVSMSPLSISIRCKENVWIVKGFLLFLCRFFLNFYLLVYVLGF